MRPKCCPNNHIECDFERKVTSKHSLHVRWNVPILSCFIPSTHDEYVLLGLRKFSSLFRLLCCGEQKLCATKRNPVETMLNSDKVFKSFFFLRSRLNWVKCFFYWMCFVNTHFVGFCERSFFFFLLRRIGVSFGLKLKRKNAKHTKKNETLMEFGGNSATAATTELPANNDVLKGHEAGLHLNVGTTAGSGPAS